MSIEGRTARTTSRGALSDPAYQAFLALRTVFTVAPIVFGLDKFANLLTDWPGYLAGWVNDIVPGSGQQAMYAVGVIEIVAGLAVALAPRFGGAAGRGLACGHHRQPAHDPGLLRRRAARLRAPGRRFGTGPARRQVRTRPTRPSSRKGGPTRMTVSEPDRFAPPYPVKRQRLRIIPGRGEIDLVAAEQAVADLLIALGKDPAGEHLTDTPGRVARSYAELLTPPEFDFTTFPNDEGYDELVLAASIPVNSLSEHHLLPFHGVAHVGYLPGDRILGLSKLARVVAFARDLQVQERLTKQVAEALMAASFRSAQAAHAQQQLWEDRYARCEALVERAIERGELPPHTDARRLLIAATAPLYHQLVLLRTTPDPQLPGHAATTAALAAAAGAFTRPTLGEES